jgi:serine/threonine protein kinase
MIRPEAGLRVSNYLLEKLIGRGSFGEVWLAKHHVFNEPVAIKIPTDAQYVRHLQREGLAVYALRDPHIVRAIDLDPYADIPYLVMEYVDGPSVRDLLNQSPNGLPIPTTLGIATGILSALRSAHEAGIVHRDIKPANILISGNVSNESISPDRVKVTDFGLGHQNTDAAQSILQSGSMTGELGNKLAGTPAYMAPEQREGQAVDGRCDLYALGAVLHEMLTGKLPQGTDHPSDLRSDVPNWLDRIFERSYTGLSRRFISAVEMQQAIERYWQAPRVAGQTAAPPVRIRRVGARWVCNACGGSCRQDHQFCIHCGVQLVERVPRCPSCHAYVGRADNYCIMCGTDLRLRAS